MSDEILINRVFSGYDVNLKLGYEAINLINSDNENDENYIYAMPDGVYSKEHFGKIKAVLIVRGIDNNRLEVLAKATNLKYILEEHIKDIEDNVKDEQIKNSYKIGNKNFKDEKLNQQERNNRKTYNELLDEKQKDIIKDITYDGIPFNKIFGEPETKDKIHAYVTFIAKEYSVPKEGKHIYLVNNAKEADGKEFFFIKRERLSSTHLSNFIPNYNLKKGKQKDEKANFETLNSLIDDKNLWERKGKNKLFKNLENNEIQKIEKQNTFLEFMNQIDNETIYSNMIVNVLKENKKLCIDFLKWLRRSNDIDENIIIEKEVAFSSKEAKKKGAGRIDILIKSDEYIYVIENKINSNLNGVKKENDKISQTQLDKYVAFIDSNFNNKKAHYFIFSPVYNNIKENLKQTKMTEGAKKNVDKYVIKTYNDLYVFFEEYKSQKDTGMDPYYEEFLKDLNIHAKSLDEYHFDLMMRKFTAAIEQAKSKDK